MKHSTVIYVLLNVPRRCFFCGSFLLFMFRVCQLYCHCSLVVTCWERAYLLALLYVMFSCGFWHFLVWCPGSGVVLDCIDSLSLPSSLFFFSFNLLNQCRLIYIYTNYLKASPHSNISNCNSNLEKFSKVTEPACRLLLMKKEPRVLKGFLTPYEAKI